MSGSYKIIQSLARAFLIIDCFTEEVKELTLNEISEKVDLNINTTRGLVQTMLHYNYLSYDLQDKHYRLGSNFLEKVEIAQYDYTEKIIEMIRGDLQRIADQYFVSTRFHSVENLSITTLIERKPSRSRYMLSIHNQTDFPLTASASGKLILAHLSETHLNQVLSKVRWEKYGQGTITDSNILKKQLKDVTKNNVAIERDELGDGYASIAVPIFRDEQLVYTISVVSTTQLINDSYDALIQELRDIQETIHKLAEFQ
ncbi:IclR family transcriptional regulator [Aerococcus viridans]|uniref:IclR family transcriptional regulator n=1 Tax=Aerococcus viridans TaxID=1377 RepID=UPI0028FD5236|nr:IclR family transcriptional regulator [Aerococcus viridans]